MHNVVHLDEYKIKKDIKKVQKAMYTVKSLIANGIKVPNDILINLQALAEKLEKKLEALCESDEKNAAKKI